MMNVEMFEQVPAPGKSLLTEITLERAVASMRADVSLEIALLPKGKVTLLTAILFLSFTVNLTMTDKVSITVECLPTEFTPIWLLTCMYDKMSGEMALVAVRGWTLITFKGFVSTPVDLDMLYEVFLLTELFTTILTCVNLDWFPGVHHLHMSVKVTLVDKGSVTLLALELLRSLMDLHMLCKVSLETVG